MLEKLKDILFKSVSISALVTFRVLFGTMMLISTIRFISLGWIDEQLIDAVFQFKYYGFGWVKPLPAMWMYALYALKIVACLGIITGTYYRASVIYFFFAFTYAELIDKTYYLNHYYFVSLVCFIMIFLPANRWASGDVFFRKIKAYRQVPAIALYIVLFQVGLVYFYAGIAKLHPSWWLEAMPLKIWLPAQHHLPVIGSLFYQTWVAYAMSWTGLLFDLTIPFWLLSRWWKPAFAAVVFFHIATGIFFQIGMFPIIMIFTVPVFFPQKFHDYIWNRFSATQNSALSLQPFAKSMILYSVILYAAFQILFPWRYLLYPGDVFWTEQGYRFGWRVMLMEKAGTAIFYVKDGPDGREGEVYNNEFLKPHQEKQMAMQPDMILEFAHFLAEYYKKEGMENPQVRAEVYVTLNGQKSRLLVDPSVNLAAMPNNLKHKDWILSNKPENKEHQF